MPEPEHRPDRFTGRSEAAQQTRAEIEDWLAGRGSIVAIVLLLSLVIALIVSAVHV